MDTVVAKLWSLKSNIYIRINFNIPLAIAVPPPCRSHIHPCSQCHQGPNDQTARASMIPPKHLSVYSFFFTHPRKYTIPQTAPSRSHIEGTQTMRETSITLRKGVEVYPLAFIIVPLSDSKNLLPPFGGKQSTGEVRGDLRRSC